MSAPYVPALAEDVDTLSAALAYAEAGWHAVPVAAGGKNPGAVVGGAWQDKSSRDPQQIAAWFAGTDHGIALHVGRARAVVLDIDDPAAEGLAALVAELDAIGAPWQATNAARTRRHYLLAMPEGRDVGNSSAAVGVAKVDVRGRNGVIVVAPTPHARAADGGLYSWGRTGPVPAPTAALAARMTDASAPVARLDGGARRVFLDALRPGPACDRVRGLVAGVRWGGSSRYEEACRVTLALLHAGREGHAGVREALAQLGAAYHEQVAGERRDPTEWRRQLAGAVDRAAGEGPIRSVDGCNLPEAATLPAELLPPVPAPAAVVAPAAGSLNLPEELWRRESLRTIRQAAHSRGRCGDVALAGVLATLAASAPVDPVTGRVLTVDTGSGGDDASLNLLVAVVGPSGTGKSSGLSVARRLIKTNSPVETYPLGSGEGIAEAFWGEAKVETGEMARNGEAKTERVRRQVRHNALFELDEGAALSQMWERKGSTLGEALRSAFSGEQIGQQNAAVATTRRLGARQYALALTIGFQPSTALPLLADVDTGTPQRFLYVWATDPRIPRPSERPGWPGEIVSPFPPSVPTNLPAAGGVIPVLRRPDPITIAPSVRDEIGEIDYLKATATLPAGHPLADPFRSQHPVLRVKLAVLLALIEGRREVDEDDWRLAGMVLDTSDRVREHLQALGEVQAGKERQARDEAAGREETYRARARHEVAEQAEDKAARRLAVWAAVKVREAGEPLTLGALRKRTRSSDRPQVEAALALAVELEWLTEDGGKYAPGRSRPEGG